MTPRQRTIHARALAHRDELVACASDRIGFDTIGRLPLKFVPGGYERQTLIVIRRLPDTVAYREHTPWLGKRYAAPAWRTRGPQIAANAAQGPS